MKVLSAALLLTAGTAVSAAAQQPVLDSAVAAAVEGYTARYLEPDCKLSKGHFKVSSGAVYLKTSVETPIPGNKDRALESGNRVLLEAITQNGQDQNAAAWYYLGRIYLRRGDVAGADSAFKRAQALAPDCSADIMKFRKVAFAPIVNRGTEFSKNKQDDSAMVYYRRAAMWYPESAIPASRLAALFTGRQMDDSALVYYDAALKATTTTDTADVKLRNLTAFNRALLLTRAGRYPEATAAFDQYLTWQPGDVDAQKGMIQALRGAGKADSAAALEKKFGVTVGGGATAVDTGAVAVYNKAATAFNAKQYAVAASAAESFLATVPNNREALYIRAQSLLELKKGPEAVKAANALLAVDPMSETGVALLGAAYAVTKNSAAAVETRQRLNAMTISISSVTASPTGAGVSLTATATGRAAMDKQMKPMAATPVPLVFEFLDKDGTVVATQEATVPALKKGEKFALKLEVQGQGVTGWRYHQK